MEDTAPTGSDYAAPAIHSEPLSIRQAAQIVATRNDSASAPAPEAAAPDSPPPAPDRGVRDERGRFARTEQDEEQNTAPEADVSDPVEEQAPAEPEPEADDPADNEPSIDPPRSWTKEEKEAFKLLPREHQERISERERTREVEIRRSQNQAAELRKAAEAEKQQLEKARTQYEAALPRLMGALQAQMQSAFPDIKSQEDVQKLATDDPLRYVQWDAHQKRLAGVAAQARQVEQRQAYAQRQQADQLRQEWAEFAKDQDRRFAERAPEFRDPAKRAKAVEGALNYLSNLGFSEDDIGPLWEGQRGVSLRDARLQEMVRDAMQWRQAQAKAKTAPKAPLPPVQKPGVAPAKNDGRAAEIQALTAKLEAGEGGIRDKLSNAAALLRAQRAQKR